MAKEQNTHTIMVDFPIIQVTERTSPTISDLETLGNATSGIKPHSSKPKIHIEDSEKKIGGTRKNR